MKRTPSPWNTKYKNPRHSLTVGTETHFIAFMADDSEESKANAQLIAAAPELLKTLQAAQSKSWVHNAAITQDIEALRRIALEYVEWWNFTALPLIDSLEK